MSNPLVSVAVVGRDLWPMTQQSLEGLIFTMSVPWELVFITNGSTDKTKEVFEQIAPTWKWHFFEGYLAQHYKRPVSLAAAWNKAYKMISPSAQYVLFANNDIVYYQAGWWDRIQQALDGGFQLTGIQEMTWGRFRFIEGSLFAARREHFEAVTEDGRLFDTRLDPLEKQPILPDGASDEAKTARGRLQAALDSIR